MIGSRSRPPARASPGSPGQRDRDGAAQPAPRAVVNACSASRVGRIQSRKASSGLIAALSLNETPKIGGAATDSLRASFIFVARRDPEPAASNDHIAQLEELMADAAPLDPDEHFAIPDLSDEEWTVFAAALDE